MSAFTNVLETVLVLASPITQEEQVSKDGEETVYLSRAQLDALNAQDLQTALRQVPGLGISRYGASRATRARSTSPTAATTRSCPPDRPGSRKARSTPTAA